MMMSSLIINRFMVLSKGKNVYNEVFHKGLNIIRGQNGSGKSTILELVYYVLGADHIDWKEEALKCDYVIAEIIINNHILSLKREIKIEGIPPLYVFWGKLDDATITSWEVYSMRRSTERESFSQIMLRSLNIPDSSENNSLTMHQILRILYIDQLSPVNLLMRPERFDPTALREAVSKTLMGAYDIQLLADENKLKQMKNDMEKYESEIKNISYIIRENNFNLSIYDVRKKIDENIERIKKLKLI
jgi:energy-coupling factor transporter ATP-binding protein EcfA2